MPLAMAAAGDEVYIKRVGGREETRRFLENLGFVPGTMVKVVSKTGENLIVSVKDARIAVSSELAKRIII
ncbi:MAG: ferrous iron transport protein A [Oscillospiraceae bacterium]|jgi:ferrous iron transport protein A|nr:ferrous iron transport protein A [Oscillospiraceae bacterium]